MHFSHHHSRGILLSFSLSSLWATILVVPILVVDVDAQPTFQPVDLSMDWEEAPLYNRNKAYCTIQDAMKPDYTRGYVVLRDGLLLAEGYTAGNQPDDKNQIYSATKSWSTFLVGVLVDQGKLSRTDTLGDIFDRDDDWEGVHQAEEKKTITVQEILTMTSGLVPGLYAWCSVVFFFCPSNQDTVQKVLGRTKYDEDQRGEFSYLPGTHTVAQIINRRAGESPRSFATNSGVFEALGITNDDFDWDSEGGVEGSASGLKSNPRVLAKLGQLYLQKGASSSTNQLVSSSWVASATSNQLEDGDSGATDTPLLDIYDPIFDGYGYHWKMPLDGGSGARKGAAAATGAYGQHIVVLPARNTVIVVMGVDDCLFCLLGSLPKNIDFVETIIDNLNDLSIEQTDCTKN